METYGVPSYQLITSLQRYVATWAPSNTLMQTILSDIANSDAWTLSHYCRPKLYNSIQGQYVDLVRAHKVRCPHQVYATSSVGQHKLGWQNTELALCTSSLRPKDSQNFTTAHQSRMSGSTGSSGFEFWGLKICDGLATVRNFELRPDVLHAVCTRSLVFDQIQGP